MAPNLAIIAIPAYYILSLVPHQYAISVATQGDLSKFDNRNPRDSDYHAKLKETLPADQFAKWARAESAHANNMENFPLFTAAIFAGLFAEQATKGTIGGTYVSSGISTGLTRFVYGWFATRFLYNIAYITTTTNQWSYLRSGIYFAGVGLAVEQFWNAAQVLGY